MAEVAEPAPGCPAGEAQAGGDVQGGPSVPAAVRVASGADRDEAQGECISVIARVRPDKCPSEQITLKERQVDIFVPRSAEVCSNHIEEYNFKFSKVLGPNTTQEDVFNVAVRDMVIGALDGINCTVFAYGQTGSGKTHTICGGKGSYSERGIVPRSLGCVFDAIERRRDGVNYTVSMSFIEIYKDIGYDLLSKDFGQAVKHFPVVTVSIVGEEPVMTGAKRVPIASEDQGLEQYYLGDMHRTVAETPHNLNSSRSHCVFTIFIEASDPAAQRVRSSKIQIVDLAGSERLKPYESGSQNSKFLMDQAVAINVSLHWLAQVISALNTPGRRGVVPYRNSFLTKLLKDALGGNAKAVMFATINPSDPALPETISTCRFAQHVANVQTFSRVNEEMDPQLVIASLKRENAELKAVIQASEGGSEAEVSDEELRSCVKAYLEDEGHASEGAVTVRVGSLSKAFVAFRIFRDFFWDLLRGRGSVGDRAPVGIGHGGSEQQPPEGCQAAGRPCSTALESELGAGNSVDAPLAALQASPGQEGLQEELQRLQRALESSEGECRMLRATCAARGSSQPAAGLPSAAQEEQCRRLRRALEEREHECRMLRAAAAAQPAAPPRAPPRPAKPKALTVSAATQTEALPAPKKAKKREQSRPVDPRPKGMRTFIGFSPEDVVDRFGRDDSVEQLPVPRTERADPRVPDFRNLRPSDEDPAEESSDAEDQVSGAAAPAAAVLAALAPQAPASATPTPATQEVTRTPGKPAQAAPGAASASWLRATTALTAGERAVLGDPAQAYQVFLQHDFRAQDVWPGELQSLRAERRERMEEARALGAEIEQSKEAVNNMQAALESLKRKLREAEEEAAVDPSSEQRAATLRELLAAEEPKLIGLFNEKRQRYECDCARLKELRREVTHLEHGERQLEAVVQSEFRQWREAVRERYPETEAAGALVPAAPEATAQSASSPAATAPAPALAGTPAVPTVAPADRLAAAEAALATLRQRLQEAHESGDEARAQMLAQLLANEEPRLERLRAELRGS